MTEATPTGNVCPNCGDELLSRPSRFSDVDGDPFPIIFCDTCSYHSNLHSDRVYSHQRSVVQKGRQVTLG